MDRCEFVRRKPKSMKTKRAVQSKEPLTNENPKRTLYLHGEKTSDISKEAVRYISKVQNSQFTTKMHRPNKTHPFESTESIEFFGFKNDASLFCFHSHSKKRPHNIVLGRHFNFKVLDMLEIGVHDLREDSSSSASIALGSKPAMIFLGAEFDFPIFDRIRNLLLDYFGGHYVEHIGAVGVDSAICVSLKTLKELPAYDVPSEPGTVLPFPENSVAIQLAHMAVRPKVGDTGVSVEIVPDTTTVMEFIVRRAKFATPKEFAHACKIPAILKMREKGVTRDAMGNLRGQIHVGKQDLDGMVKRRFKRTKGESEGEGMSQLEAILAEDDLITTTRGGARRKTTSGVPDTADI